jgi:hypothetical protein
MDEPPRARVERWKPAAPLPAPALAPSFSGEAAQPGTAVYPAPTQVSPQATTTQAAQRGESSLSLESIRYTEEPGQRTATLTIDGAPPVTLHQGGTAGGVEVQLILPAAVYIRRGGDVVALGDVR